ncbi:uncharacterized protein TEOVI_000443900 [Trypanosoma equiperdum]|uniref:Uncharacterized protein n=4 Tax=Trypanozoon TaxID=39700 RepID=Q57ZL1_TRYB2|nr:hypothetical protein, conserved [Trypanosoma brucei gambiense DAL972]XP_843894.1 hypothetical protein, conserved [Trypanosoma brucei brucei TREU927]AAX79471.1 hypothetical protein, conserved [Trypanosoma brucei]RHW73837.1 hypothetical protein DPX39_030029200 [Trypanosoma brucei equiperdum]SCU72855.1 hypothetical protein, conserved [Trypanosoma equiperdum]GGW83266.1 hypothetical protein GCM10010340_70690 [Streptomyces albaduncus]AAZ10335.1 hypothetical protein, conserved [Trypanosoma brucei|eukprot:XP_011772263.1 hypothetical protein, conserved [Trypanosoma brucei gambiense DAL972]
MRLLARLGRRLRARYELARGRMNLRRMSDHELIGRYCGLAFIPFTVCVCGGSMRSYATDRVHVAMEKRDKESSH